MTAEQRADYERRELLRVERCNAFNERMRIADLRAQEQAARVLEAQLRRKRQPELEFSI